MADNNQPRIRQIAYKVPVSAIINAKYVKEEGEWQPNYIKINELKVSRVNLMLIVVEILHSQGGSLQGEDGTGRIFVRGLDNIKNIDSINVGDVINIIGRPREFNSEKYIIPEIIKKVNPDWMVLRKLELKDFKVEKIEDEKHEVEEISSDEGILSKHDRIINYIRENDSGTGIDIEDIIKDCKDMDCEKIILEMIKEGELFEIVSGRVKVLE